MAGLQEEDVDLLKQWREEESFEARNALFQKIKDEKIFFFPKQDVNKWEEDGGLYPDNEDPYFVPKLMKKAEMYELKQPSVKDSLDQNKCSSVEDFELSPVQKFVSRFINPNTPYRSALLYHGVGVGKTCAAVTISESFLDLFPQQKISIIAPRNIQAGFKRTIFDEDGLQISDKPDIPNHHRGCTGDTYLNLTNTFYEKEKELIKNRVKRVINQRYDFYGYGSFYNYVSKLLKSARTSTQRREIIRRNFSGRVLIIDEAHNLRDNPAESEEEAADDASVQDTESSKDGKRLTPLLREVLTVAEDLTLVLMTATPMYNSYVEIIFLLNLLLLNDKKPEIRLSDVFDTKKQTFLPGGKEILGEIASRYISFMRGENPITFPLRLEPETDDRLEEWPGKNPRGEVILEKERIRSSKLPILEAVYEEATEREYLGFVDRILESREGLGITNLDKLTQAGNFIYPADEDEDILNRIGIKGFQNTFELIDPSRGQYRCILGDAKWLVEDNLTKVSGKANLLLKRLKGCKGVGFVFSRFVEAGGALPIALCLEANGYLPYGREPLLQDGNQNPEKGGQCAVCDKREKEHAGVGHAFKQARYILLTGATTQVNPILISASRKASNVNGEEIKVILGSEIASEGLDFKYIREIFIFDSWYHLNKLEQVIGRGIRNCSHASLPPEKRNCTISLLVNRYVTASEKESIDLYSYRQALAKAITVGNVTRVLKEFAIDCSINYEAIQVKGLPLIDIIDSQGVERKGVSRDDVEFTSLCDWLGKCDYECRFVDPEKQKEEKEEEEEEDEEEEDEEDEVGTIIEISKEDLDYSTYDEYTARFQKKQIKRNLQLLLTNNTVFIKFENIAQIFKDIPRDVLKVVLNEVIGDKQSIFEVKRDGLPVQGRFIYKNGYYLFQPVQIKDKHIPMAIRLGRFPTPRDTYPPVEVEEREVVEPEETPASSDLWDAIVEFVSQIRNGTALVESLPQKLLNNINLPTSKSGEKITDELFVISFLYPLIKANEDVRRLFSQIVFEILWDEYVPYSLKEKILISQYKEPWMEQLLQDGKWIDGKTLYLRLFNSKTQMIEYFQEYAGSLQKSEASVKEYLEKSIPEKDPLKTTPITKKSTGSPYGFVIFKRKEKELIFKTAIPEDGKIAKGNVCNVSNKKPKIDSLAILFSIFEKKGKYIFNLNKDKIEGFNSVKLCSIFNFILRYADKIKLDNKRWFYRIVEALVHGHTIS